MSGLADPETIRARAEEVRQRIVAAGTGDRAVTLIAVTKGFPAELARRAVAGGLVDLGENYAQELVAKAELVAGGGRDGSATAGGSALAPRWHFIGGLQSNKVKLLAEVVHLWQTVDRTSLIDAIARRAPGAAVLIQVNTTDEPQKSGCEPEQAQGLVDHARQQGLVARGLMTIGPTSPGIDPRPAFELLRRLGERCGVEELSMGMSSDFEAAVGEGSTMVRIGSALFGARPSAGERSTV